MANWQSYIPDYIIEQLLADPTANLLEHSRRFEAVVLFADVSGFTAISEALGKSGRGGTEELTTILNRYFEPMIALIRSYGGIISKFGGDAMTVLFPYTPENQTLVVQQAVQCALDMQARMSDYKAIPTSAGTFELAMKAGLAAGTLFSTVVGNPDVRLEYILAGRALDQCAEAEHHATRGEVVVHEALLSMAEGIEVPERRAEFGLVTGMCLRPSTVSRPELGALTENAIRTVSMFLHPTISQRVREDLMSFINEHRKVTVLFVRFENLDYDHDPQVGDTLQRYFSKVVEIIYSYDGYLNKIDMGDKGSKYIVVFGAPIAHEDDVERALQCALDLQEIEGFPVRIGVNTGFVYCGLVGSSMRQEYTVMGDVVNLSARLMQASQSGQVLIAEDTFGEGEGFTWISLPAIQVKGKTDPIKIHALRGKKNQPTVRFQEMQYGLPMVGRGTEMKLAQRVVRRVLEGRGQLLGITAEAGMGKSRLSAEIIRLALAEGMTGFGGECVSHGTKNSYLVWQNILRNFFGLDSQTSLETQIAQVERFLSQVNPEIVFRAPLLREAINLPIPHNDITQAMDARIRKGSLENLLVDCIRHQAQSGPVLFVLEDCHWIDPLSNDLLEVVARNIADLPVLIVVIYRPPETGNIQPHVLQFGHFTEIRLDEFTPEEAAQLIEMKLDQLFRKVEIPAAFVERTVDKAGGNPFFIDEMLNLIHDRGIDPTDVHALETLILPDSLNSLIISRIDQLAEGPKTTLKVASVIGRLFKASWLWGIYPQLGTSEQIKAQLEHLDRLEITPLDKPEPELEYLFKHILTREVAYESLAVSTRQMLHEQVGHYIETQYPAELEQFLNVLAYHYGVGQNTAKQREYFQKAGYAAQQAFANDAAIDYYRRLLPLLPDEEKVGVYLRLGDVLQLVGNWDETEHLVREAIALAEKLGNRQDFAHAHRALGDILSRKGAHLEALEALQLAQTIFESLNDLTGVDFALRLIGSIHWRQSDYDAALRCFEKCHQVSEKIGNQNGAFRATGNIGLIYKTRGDYNRALEAYEQSQKIARQIGDRVGERIIIMNMGNVYLEIGKYSEALTRYYRSLQIAQEVGDRQGVGLVIGNIGNLYWYTGDFTAMLACQAMHLHTALELGELWGVSFSTSKMALAYMQLGQFAEAEAMLSRAITLGKIMEALHELSGFYFDRGNLLNAIGKPEDALDMYGEAIQLAADVDNVVVQFEAQIARLRTQVDLGLKDAQTAIAQLHHLRDTWLEHFHGDEEQEAPIHYEIWKLDPTDEFHRARAAELYAHLYEHTPSSEFRSRYEELTGAPLPEPPPLPPLPDIVTRKPIHLDTLLEQIDALIQEAQAAAHPSAHP
ncbi:MAG: tetratricopeptide repeat protein [Anaerolineales bacterium]|nr:tetratricopeptide repeat protein [Anaerolineales bacterium]